MPTTGPRTKLPSRRSSPRSPRARSRTPPRDRTARDRCRARSRIAGAEAGFPIEHTVRLHDLRGERGRRRVGSGGVEDRLERRACGRRVGDPLGVGVDERLGVGRGVRAGARRRERHAIVAAQLLVAERPARPVETDEERPESGADLAGAFEIVLARRHRTDPGVVLPDGRRHVAHPAVAHEEDVGVRLFSELLGDPRDQAAVEAVGIVGALRARAVDANEVVSETESRDGSDRHGVPPLA